MTAQRLDHEDRVATEEPLEIRVAAPGSPAQRVAVTMRTPGHDFELAAGWLVHEGVTTPEAVRSVRYCTDESLGDLEEFNVVTVDLAAPPLALPAARLVNSACGVCGTDSVQDVLGGGRTCRAGVARPRRRCWPFPDRLREQQPGFSRTGGLHAAGLFDARRRAGRRTRGRRAAQRRRQGDRVADPRRRAGAAGARAQRPDRLRARAEGRGLAGLGRGRRRRAHLAGPLARRGQPAWSWWGSPGPTAASSTPVRTASGLSRRRVRGRFCRRPLLA